MVKQVRATKFFSLWAGRVQVYGFGKRYGDFKPNRTEPQSFLPIAKKARLLGIESVWCPDPREFNARLASHGEFLESFELLGVRFMLGVKASGLMIPHNEAVMFASGDCPTLVLVDFETNQVYGAHCGVRDLVDKCQIEVGPESRAHWSVIDAIIHDTTDGGDRPHNIRAFSCVGINSGYTFSPNHPDRKIAKFNELLFNRLTQKYGHFGREIFVAPVRAKNGKKGPADELRPHELIAAELMANGVNPNHLYYDGCDTLADVDGQNRAIWWSNKRGDKGRNLVLVHAYPG